MEWYLATNYCGVSDILDFKNEEDLTLCIWQLQESFPGMVMEVFCGVEDR